MDSVKKYLSLVTFSHTIFAMPFALLGATVGFIAIEGLPWIEVARLLLLVVLCMIFIRSAAMAFNRYLDADIDAKNERTKTREIPSGVISRSRALIFTIVMSILFVVTTYFTNSLCFYLSPVALGVVLLYSYTKRFTSLCHLVLGLGLALAPVGAYMAVTQTVNWGIILLGISVLLWVAGFDIIYSLQDREFDKSEKLHSIPVRLGVERSIKFSILIHVLSALTLTASMAFLTVFESPLVILALIFFIGTIIYQHTLYSASDLSRINKQYMATNGLASLVFCALVLLGIFV